MDVRLSKVTLCLLPVLQLALIVFMDAAAQSPCGPYLFECQNGQCIHPGGVCDGGAYFNCDDGSDDATCTAPCPSRTFKCNDNNCINIYSLCNGVNDCPDNSDEGATCVARCPSNMFTCTNYNCKALSQVCDGTDQCGDNSDEANCGSPPCPPEAFQCDDGTCIRSDKACDGTDDCMDQSDEVCAWNECYDGTDTCPAGSTCTNTLQAFRCSAPVRCDPNCRWNSGCAARGRGKCDGPCKLRYKLNSDFKCINRRCRRWLYRAKHRRHCGWHRAPTNRRI